MIKIKIKMLVEKIQKQNVGNAGEYYIASRLSALNFVATITLGRAEKYDILAISPKGRVVKLSVKTTQVEKAKDFPLSHKDECGQSEDFYYAFVKLNNFTKDPDFWVIPSKVLCPLLKNSHEKWGNTLNRKGEKHGHSDVRLLPIELTAGQRQYYPENWEKDVEKYYKNLNQLL
ncbi:MAG: hypothetical protein A2360_03760 [Candidatus Staskawiczbacteria bacterium RIFOXYB1_FULL_32_11]|uniref:Aspartate ammonia-lyase n=1 Tax=Candidatus Staskawiczbacteria bacterium RIFOXYD1_FULL_32_13 TaxID=1802234 RepID=A0A1G2JN71_9BACT|nr:MAG: hypothetical protein A2256_02230 [Candidatus Staskawiczbacteria bacterium RIFOXYA2_FULL_32_7]OGZ78257.1 MAG: hypothetical protein A2360_03760 [Candidatus Staskawiczbacteria bacterium RIFOXYB1_FULL_32_11]OGZ87688.1 MAG: hypothetical protein A2561_03280 [Candidatus Staskawiczbacteria bacterium RIFOXYD1_FULL_32_13]